MSHLKGLLEASHTRFEIDGETFPTDGHWSHCPAIPKKSSSKILSLNMSENLKGHKTDFDIFFSKSFHLGLAPHFGIFLGIRLKLPR